MKKIIVLLVSIFPTFAFAQQITDINSLAGKATNIGNLIITLAISLAILWIIVSVVWYLVKGATNEEERKKGGNAILYGVIGLFVILSIWGLVNILKNSFKTDTARPTTELENATKLEVPKQVP